MITEKGRAALIIKITPEINVEPSETQTLIQYVLTQGPSETITGI